MRRIIPILILLLLALTGCTALWQPPGSTSITFAVDTHVGHPGPNGFIVTFTVTGASGMKILDPGDSSPVVEFTGSTIQHAYTGIGKYEATIRAGGESKRFTIVTVNKSPIVYEPFSTSAFDWMDKIVLDARYQEHGCHNGTPIMKTGVYDPDGDTIVAYEWHIVGPDKNGNIVEYSVFDSERNNIADKKTPDGVIVFFPGWTQNTPPYPFMAPMSSTQPPSPPTPTQPPTKIVGQATITLKAYDRWGGMGELTWSRDIQSSACSN